MSDGVRIRAAKVDELPLIRDSWTKSFGSVSRLSHSTEVARWAWFRIHFAGITDLLAQSKVVVADLPDFPDVALGWVAWEEPSDRHPLTVHYVYVKPRYRRSGIGRALLEHALANTDERGFRTSHRTPDGGRLLEHREEHHGQETGQALVEA